MNNLNFKTFHKIFQMQLNEMNLFTEEENFPHLSDLWLHSSMQGSYLLNIQYVYTLQHCRLGLVSLTLSFKKRALEMYVLLLLFPTVWAQRVGIPLPCSAVTHGAAVCRTPPTSRSRTWAETTALQAAALWKWKKHIFISLDVQYHCQRWWNIPNVFSCLSRSRWYYDTLCLFCWTECLSNILHLWGENTSEPSRTFHDP